MSRRAVFLGYRGGKSTQKGKYALIKVDGVDDEGKAAQYIGRRVVWTSNSGNSLIGRIVGTHGRKGVLRAKFRKGLPGQAIGKEFDIR